MGGSEERAAARAQLDFDERLEHVAELQHVLHRAVGELEHIYRLAAVVPSEMASPERVLDVLAGLSASSGRIMREQAVLDNLLAEARVKAIKLARVHGASWEAIGDVMGIGGRNAAKVYKQKVA